MDKREEQRRKKERQMTGKEFLLLTSSREVKEGNKVCQGVETMSL